ncbi:MAG TPA: hypothetical protein VFK36_03565 [Gemmatimonadales bacterium]|nr:hypothetical protein [Gemmatimonadales bacterium]
MLLILPAVILSGCAPSLSQRRAEAERGSAAALRFPDAAAESPHFAAWLQALNEQPFYADSSAGLQVRLLILPSAPKWLLFHLEETVSGATLYYRVEGKSTVTLSIDPRNWSALRDTIAAVTLWDARWESQPSLDGVLYGLEVRDGARHRAFWLLNPALNRNQNAGFLRLMAAIEAVRSAGGLAH